MKSDKLYRVEREDLPKLEQLLYRCFAHDPLYETLIPDAEVRKRLMPELFQCDMDEFYETCEIFADSKELNSILVVSDEAEHINMFHFFLTESWATIHTEKTMLTAKRKARKVNGLQSCWCPSIMIHREMWKQHFF